MDTTILLYSLAAFCVFIILQVIVFRLTLQDEALRWLGKLYCMTGATLSLLLVPNPTVAFICFVLFTGLAGVYTLCIFSAVEASLTLRILSEVSQAGKKGLAKADLLHRYNKHVIVKRRLERLLRSGDLIFRRGNYIKTGNKTAYMMRDYIMNIFLLLFP
jgi:hypothetical protein